MFDGVLQLSVVEELPCEDPAGTSEAASGDEPRLLSAAEAAGAYAGGAEACDAAAEALAAGARGDAAWAGGDQATSGDQPPLLSLAETAGAGAYAAGDGAEEEREEEEDEGAAAVDAEGGDGDLSMEDEELGQSLALVSLLQGLRGEPRSDHAVGEAAVPEGARARGVVQKFAAKRGFGIIAPSAGGQERYFAHWSEIRSNDAWPLLAAGAEVEFTPGVNSEGRLVATGITSVGTDEVLSVEEVDRVFREVSSFIITGEVSWFHRAGYGFIVSDTDVSWPEFTPAGSQIYVSREDLVVAEGCSGFNLTEGMRVQFRVFKPPDKPVAAAEVTAVGGAALVCPTLPPDAPWRGSESDSLIRRGRTKRVDGLARGRLRAANMSLSGVALERAVKAAVQRSIGKVARRRMTKEAGRAAGISAASPAGECLSELGGEAAVSLIGVPCRFFAEGRCLKGPSCRFLHSEQQPALDPSGLAPVQPASKAVLATVPCKYFVQGRCVRGDHCEFSHDTSEADPLPLEKKLALECTFFARGFCSRGASCQFAHGAEELFEISVRRIERQGTPEPP